MPPSDKRNRRPTERLSPRWEKLEDVPITSDLVGALLGVLYVCCFLMDVSLWCCGAFSPLVAGALDRNDTAAVDLNDTAA